MHFLPIRRADLIELLCQQPNIAPAAQDGFRQWCRLLEATFHHEFHTTLETLKDAYAPLDPDRVTVEIAPCEEDQTQRLDRLFERFDWLLTRANYVRLAPDQIRGLMDVVGHWGVRLDVDFDVLERLEVYVRGAGLTHHLRRRATNWFRLEKVEVPTFQRLVVIFRLREDRLLKNFTNTRAVYIKLFKNIPHSDLEMLLPGTRVRMRWQDQTKIALPTVTGLGITGFKLFKGAALALLYGGLYGALAFLALVGGTVGYGMRSFSGYQTAKQRYQLKVSQNLYFQNLDNNAGVLNRLLDEAEEQECREAILAYFLLWHEAGSAGWTLEEIDRRAEQLLLQSTGQKCDFEVGDALEKLHRLGLVETMPEERVAAVSLESSLARLDKSWDALFHYGKASPGASSNGKPHSGDVTRPEQPARASSEEL